VSSRFIPPEEDALRQRYEKLYPMFKDLTIKVKKVLRNRIKEKNIKIHSIKLRVKKFKSFYEKIVKKEIRTDPFETLHDIAGVRVICLYRRDLNKIEEMIVHEQDEFEVIQVDTARTREKPPFGYMSDHYVVRIKEKLPQAPLNEIAHPKCEIQVRTILMHAWATVSHHLEYKKDVDVPSELKRDFDALSGLFYVADSHFEMFKKGVEESREALKSVSLEEFDMRQEINLDTLYAYLSLQFRDRKKVLPSQYSDLVFELRKAGYNNIGKLHEAVKASIQAQSLIEKEERATYTDVGAVRTCLDLFDKSYRKRLIIAAEEDDYSNKYLQLIKKYESMVKKS